MPKTKTFSPRFIRISGPNGDYLSMALVPMDADGKARGEQFSLLIANDGSRMLGPDGAVIVAPAPPAILSASISGGAAPIQAEVDTLDVAGLLNTYY
jgi:hypothetical protein